MQLHIRQAKVSDPDSEFHNKVVDIIIKDGIISKVSVSVKKTGETTIEADGKKVYASGKGILYVSPGWVDILADYSEPGHEHKETIKTGLAAAAKGGFTDVFLAPNTEPVVSTKSIIEFILKKASGNVVSLHPLGAMSQNTEGKSLAEMMDMQAHGAIAFTDGWKPVQNAGLMLKALEYIKAFNGTMIQIPEDASIATTGLMHEGITSTRLGMSGIPAEAETIIINRDLQLLRYTGSRLHFTGVSTAAGVDMIRKAKREKLNVTCSVTPYHLALTDESLSGYSSMYKVSPPLRSEKDRQALIKGLNDGTIDCITSHHRPQDWDAKEKEFEYALPGMNIQELAFNVTLQALGEKADLARLTEVFSTRAREIFNMPQAIIAKGSVAKLTIFTTVGSYTPTNMASLSKNNPFMGQELPGKVAGIINNNNYHINQ
ncbi:MAG: dihydroorotase [Taibaiella sp.]|nr:dihydroorotase [Taibaiella sp.]